MERTFHTPQPTSLYVEIGGGDVTVEALDTSETVVHVEGRDADRVVVEQRGDEIVVLRERRSGFFDLAGDLRVTVRLPHDSHLTTKLGSADLRCSGRLGRVRARSGSGSVELAYVGAEAVVQTGSGDVGIGEVRGDLRVKAGSGSVRVQRAGASTAIATGSGRIAVDAVGDDTVAKSGSGDIRLGEVSADASLTSGSGDLEVRSLDRGALRAKTASGDVHVGVRPGIPVWTDVSSVSGDVASDLEGAGRPEPGQDHIEIRATTVSGDVTLSQL